MDFDWRIVSEDNVTVQSGPYKVLGFGGNNVSFGEFRAVHGDRWRVLLKIRRDAGDLNGAELRLVVEPGGEFSEGMPELYGYSLLWAEWIGGLGVLLLVVPILVRTIRTIREKKRGSVA